jgi:hypothetical protein
VTGRWRTAFVAGALVLATGAACDAAGPGPAARGVSSAPTPGPCHDAPIAPDSIWVDTAPAVACTGPHLAEIYHTATADAPPQAAPVQPGSQAMSRLFAGCEEKATGFLGAPWYTGWVQIRVALPRPDDWAKGARAYSCQAFEVDQIGPENAVRRASSLRGALAARGPLSMGCLAARTPAARAPLVRAACDQPHEAEYVAGYTAVPPASLTQADADLVADRRCGAAVGAYTRAVGHRQILVGFAGWGPGYWWVGQVTLRCLAVAHPGKRFTASVKGIGDREPPTV